jgi:hypothetical protein
VAERDFLKNVSGKGAGGGVKILAIENIHRTFSSMVHNRESHSTVHRYNKRNAVKNVRNVITAYHVKSQHANSVLAVEVWLTAWRVMQFVLP